MAKKDITAPAPLDKTMRELVEAVEEVVVYPQIIDDLVTADSNRPLSAKMGKKLQDEKLAKADVYNGLDQTAAGTALDARQGKALNEAITTLSATYTMDAWRSGSVDTTDGTDYADSNAIRYPKVGISTGVQRMECDSEYYFLLYAWDMGGNYIGAYKTNGTFNKTVSDWAHLNEWDCSAYPNYVFKPALIGVGITPADYTHFRFEGINGSQMLGTVNGWVPVTNLTFQYGQGYVYRNKALGLVVVSWNALTSGNHEFSIDITSIPAMGQFYGAFRSDGYLSASGNTMKIVNNAGNYAVGQMVYITV